MKAEARSSWPSATQVTALRDEGGGDGTQARAHIRAHLIHEHLSLVRGVAHRFAGREQLDDLVQVGAIGLIKAADRFDPERGVPFAGYALPTVTGEIKRYLRDHGWPVRIPRREQELGRKVFASPLSDGEEHDPLGEHELELSESRALLAAALPTLDDRSRRILHLRYYCDLSQSGIAAELGMSQVQVSRLLARSLSQLRNEIGA